MGQKELDLAWVAGFVDGEGCVSIGRMRRPTVADHEYVGYEPGVYVVNTHKESVQRVYDVLSEYVAPLSPVKLRKPAQERFKAQYAVGWYGWKAVEAAKVLEPYAYTKRRQLQLLTQFPIGKHGAHHAPELAAYQVERKRLYLELHELKQSPAWRQKRTWQQASSTTS